MARFPSSSVWSIENDREHLLPIGFQSRPFWSSSVIFLFGVVFFFILRTVCLYLNAFIYFSFYTYMSLYHCIAIFVFTECASLVYHERSVNEHSFVFSLLLLLGSVLQWRNEYCLSLSHTYLFNKKFYDQNSLLERFRSTIWREMFLNFRVAQATFYEVRDVRMKSTCETFDAYRWIGNTLSYRIMPQNRKMIHHRRRTIKIKVNEYQHEISFKLISLVYKRSSVDIRRWWMMELYQVQRICKDYCKKVITIRFYQP